MTVNVDTLVMTAATQHRVYATGSETFAGPIGAAQLTTVTFPDSGQATAFALACMREQIPARAYAATVVVLH